MTNSFVHKNSLKKVWILALVNILNLTIQLWLKILFFGKIVTDNNTWNFSINFDSSTARNLKGEDIAIEFTNYGCDFIVDNKKIAGYATGVFIKNWTPIACYAWIKPGLNEEIKLVLASLITDLIGRESITISDDD